MIKCAPKIAKSKYNLYILQISLYYYILTDNFILFYFNV